MKLIFWSCFPMGKSLSEDVKKVDNILKGEIAEAVEIENLKRQLEIHCFYPPMVQFLQGEFLLSA